MSSWMDRRVSFIVIFTLPRGAEPAILQPKVWSENSTEKIAAISPSGKVAPGRINGLLFDEAHQVELVVKLVGFSSWV